ncbi:KilA-N domain-containing protein [Pseudomonas carnis]|uniref:KilA-N domain-containing protein n=1 Tax=Pseudomonas carnis TaxID=2487355 RepID=UPI00190D907F|nr:KilA-N domain-containing protein [Pseudomonas carnis]MBK3469778.1 KilA-N domain-containing protein [Pseudomonas carnis]
MFTNNQTDLLPIVIEGQTFIANTEGMWSLNEIHQTLGLPEAKRPGQWNNEIRTALDQGGNFHLAYGGANPGTWATEAGTIAYAMWVSPAFYLMVVNAFLAMRNSAVRELRQKDALLDANMPKASTLDMKARGAGLTWTEACRVAGIQQPRLALEFLAKGPMFVHVCDDFGGRTGQIRPKQQGFSSGAFVAASSNFGNREGWRVKPSGLDWLRGKTEIINGGVAEAKAALVKAKKAAQASGVDRWGRAVKGVTL